MRDHRLRERRLKLGVSQLELGCIAYFRPRSAQPMVSHVELHPHKAHPALIYKVRSALVYLESEKRRMREWQRQDDAEAAKVEALLHQGPSHPDYERVVTARLVDLLWDGRAEEFDALGEKLSDEIVRRAGEIYTDGSTPVLETLQQKAGTGR